MSDATGPGTTSNMVAGIASFLFPGLGQLLQGRIVAAVLFCLFSYPLYWLFFIGILIHLWAIIDAANWKK